MIEPFASNLLLSAIFGGMLICGLILIAIALDQWHDDNQRRKLLSYHCPECGWSTSIFRNESILSAKLRHERSDIHKSITKRKA